ncbi:hypothetical protein AMECASPLE_015545 [Ameca splendens]|uniref:Uncharacterized protein n=1 Tax=Ameca splendens TaxID=208324 RepID=A0ABV0XF41_9TELE
MVVTGKVVLKKRVSDYIRHPAAKTERLGISTGISDLNLTLVCTGHTPLCLNLSISVSHTLIGPGGCANCVFVRQQRMIKCVQCVRVVSALQAHWQQDLAVKATLI